MTPDEYGEAVRRLADNLRRVEDRISGLADVMQAFTGKLALIERDVAHLEERVEIDMTHFAARLSEFITRVEFTPVQRIVYGLAASIMGAFIMGVIMLVARVVPK